jgi:hypothetical protein
MASLRAAQALLDEARGYAPEELARLDSELARLDVRDLMGRLLQAREELARESHGA